VAAGAADGRVSFVESAQPTGDVKTRERPQTTVLREVIDFLGARSWARILRFDAEQVVAPETTVDRFASRERQVVEDAIRLAVSLGGDAGTQAAIAGGIAEAYYGSLPRPALACACRHSSCEPDIPLKITKAMSNVATKEENSAAPNEVYGSR
jgi:hypothetical protein